MQYMEAASDLVCATNWGWDTDVTGHVLGFMIWEDKKMSVVTAAGIVRTFPAGTFITKTRYDLKILRFRQEASELDIKSIYLFMA